MPVTDWALAVLIATACFYLPVVFDELTFRIGMPNAWDMAMGTIMVVLVLEATRRAMGWVLPAIVVVFILYGLFGNNLSGVLAHPGSSWEAFLSHVYLTQEGIFGIPVKVVRPSSSTSCCSACWPRAWASGSSSSTSRR